MQAVPSSILYMTTYENIKQMLTKLTTSDYLPAVAGGLARIVAVTVTSPVELVRTIQSSSSNPTTVFGLLGNILKQEGVLGLYKGYGSTLFRDVPFSALYWLVYETSRPKFQRLLRESNPAPSVINFLSGATAGVLSATLTHPFDVLKTRQQSGGADTRVKLDLRSIYSTGGVRALYRGLQLRLATVVPAGAIMITVYEFVKKLDISQLECK